MSLINDALKRVRQDSAPETPAAARPPALSLQPAAHQPVSVAGWLIPAAVVFLIISGVFFVGFAMARHSVNNAAPVETSAAAVSSSLVPVVNAGPAPVTNAIPQPDPSATKTATLKRSASSVPPAATEPPPKLQGIFYSPNAPVAIVDGKTVRPGDQFLQYRVVEITRRTATLVGADGKTVKLSMDN
jgi:hypothetical protein